MDALCSRVDVAHLRDLLIAFRNIGLVDADNVYQVGAKVRHVCVAFICTRKSYRFWQTSHVWPLTRITCVGKGDPDVRKTAVGELIGGDVKPGTPEDSWT